MSIGLFFVTVIRVDFIKLYSTYSQCMLHSVACAPMPLPLDAILLAFDYLPSSAETGLASPRPMDVFGDDNVSLRRHVCRDPMKMGS